MPDNRYTYFQAPAGPCRLVPLTEQRHWRVMNAAIKNQRLRKLSPKPVDVPKKKSYFAQDEASEELYVMASPENMSRDLDIDTQYNGPSTWDFMMLDLDVSNGSTRILQELEKFHLSFNVEVISLNLRAGLKETWEALDKLERLANWIDDVDLRQWSKAAEEHERLWKG
ncbi:hypothetical protein ARMSODRAFT_974042 [Armillaria solidipes]|uniref:Uncharacterized protein n=1 Tax=Armillaria solidipes TaxID=1076256 RepID=A0A2H3BM93_9AGAR|nr:hypothetical protein ARMSODRAFT_974042 [Armillaria solidipes]